MAKPIEIAFSLVWNRKSVEELSITEFGAFILLAQAYLYSGFDPFLARQASICSKARCTVQQWGTGRKAILGALRDALPILEDKYNREKQKRIALTKHAAVNLEKYRFNWNASQKKEVKAHSFIPQSHEPIILQPTKATPYKPIDSDIYARQTAQLAKKDKSKTIRFTDKP